MNPVPPVTRICNAASALQHRTAHHPFAAARPATVPDDQLHWKLNPWRALSARLLSHLAATARRRRPAKRWFPDGLSDDEIPLPATDAADPADRAFPDGFREWSTNGIHPTRVSDGDAGHFSVFGGAPGRPAASEV